jgi:hypothetical protein
MHPVRDMRGMGHSNPRAMPLSVIPMPFDGQDVSI